MNASDDFKWLKRITLSVVLGMFIFSIVTPFITGQLRITDVVTFYMVKLGIEITSNDERNLKIECAKLENISSGQSNVNTFEPAGYKVLSQESSSDDLVHGAEKERFETTSPISLRDEVDSQQLFEAELVNSNIDIKTSQPFAIMAHGTILIDQTERGVSRSGYRDISPVVCINGVNHKVYKTPNLRWHSGYFVHEFFQKGEFAEQLTPLFLGECPIKKSSRYEPDILRVEQVVEQSLGRAFQATSQEREKCDTHILNDTTSDRHVKSTVTGAGNQAVLYICNTLTVCSDTSKHAVEEMWLFTGNEPAKMLSSVVYYPYGEVFGGDDADCASIRESSDSDGDGNMEMYIYGRGAESWGLKILEYDAGQFVVRAEADDGL